MGTAKTPLGAYNWCLASSNNKNRETENVQPFRVYKHPVYGFKAVKLGWSWPAFLFDWIWAFSNKLWFLGSGILAAILVIHFVTAYNIPEDCRYGFVFLSRSLNYNEGCAGTYFLAAYLEGVFLIALKFGVGVIGNREKQIKVATRGFKPVGDVSANSEDHAVGEVSEHLGKIAENTHNDSHLNLHNSEQTAAVAQGAIWITLLVVLIPFFSIVHVRWIALQRSDGSTEFDRLSADVERGSKAAIDAFNHYAEWGNAVAQYKMGELYIIGKGVSKDVARGVRWLTKAAGNGNNKAMLSLASGYASGNYGSKDMQKAIIWYTKSADYGDVQAQDELGRIYLKDKDVPNDFTEALRRFERAANQSSSGQYGYVGLGTIYAKGLGVAKNIEKSRGYYLTATKWEGGLHGTMALTTMFHGGEGEFGLAELYMQGEGNSKDVREGLKWMVKAALKGNDDARMALTHLDILACKDWTMGGEIRIVDCPQEELDRLTSTAVEKELKQIADELEHPERKVSPIFKVMLPALIKSGIPILLPGDIRGIFGTNEIYAVPDSRISWIGYSIALTDSPGCDSESCKVGSIDANLAARAWIPENAKTISLANDVKGFYAHDDSSAKLSEDTIAFQLDGNQYYFSLRNASNNKELLLKIVDSAIRAGPRKIRN